MLKCIPWDLCLQPLSYIGQTYNIDLLLLFRNVNESEKTPSKQGFTGLPLTVKLVNQDNSLLLSKLADNITIVQRVDLGIVVTERTLTIIV